MTIDYIFAFPNEAAAEADPDVGAYFVDGAWRADCCLPGLAVTVNGSGGMVTVTFPGGPPQTVPGPDAPLDALWRIAIARPARDVALEASAGLEIIADRDAANAGAPMSAYILRANVPLTTLAGLTASPQFAGSNYVFGAAD
jgi:hypothetical protein